MDFDISFSFHFTEMAFIVMCLTVALVAALSVLPTILRGFTCRD